jgi:hypothetical protein
MTPTVSRWRYVGADPSDASTFRLISKISLEAHDVPRALNVAPRGLRDDDEAYERYNLAKEVQRRQDAQEECLAGSPLLKVDE